MIDKLLLATGVAITPGISNIQPNNATQPIQITESANGYISTNINFYQNESYDQDNKLIGNYYYIKYLNNNPLNINGNTFNLIGYQYTHIDVGSETAYQIIDYYIETSFNNFTFNEIELIFNGLYNNYGPYQPYYEEYSFSYLNEDNASIEYLFNNDTYTIQALDNARNVNTFIEFDGSDQDVLQATADLKGNEQAKHYRWRTRWNIDFDYENEEFNPYSFITATSDIYTSIKVNYTYTRIVDMNYSVIDIPGLMFTILGMPFAWLSTAFDLTIFPGTPYAINLSHIFFAVIGALILIVILKKVLK